MTFIVKAKPKKLYEQLEEGQHVGVLIDVVDASKNGSPRVRFVWETTTLGKDGQPLRAMQGYPMSMGEGSYLRKAASKIMGRDVGDEFDLDQLLGRSNLLIVEHNGPHAKVTGILKTTEKVRVPKDYVRVRDRDANKKFQRSEQHSRPVEVPYDAQDEDLGF